MDKLSPLELAIAWVGEKENAMWKLSIEKRHKKLNFFLVPLSLLECSPMVANMMFACLDVDIEI